MSTLPKEPQVTNSEVVAALTVAHQLRWVSYDDGENLKVLTEMEMLRVLEAAFNLRSERFNGELRQEARRLDRHMELTRIRTQKYEDKRELVQWALSVSDHVEQLLRLLADTRVVRISDEYRTLVDLMSQKCNVDTAP